MYYDKGAKQDHGKNGRFEIFPPDWGIRRRSIDAFRVFFKWGKMGKDGIGWDRMGRIIIG